MKRGGFSLVEMMVIIIILGILAAVATIKYSENVNKARVNSMVVTFRRIIDAQAVYSAKTNGYVNCANEAEIKSKLGITILSDNFDYSVEVASDSNHYNIVAEVTKKMGPIEVGQQVIITDTNTAKLSDPSERTIIEYAQAFFNSYQLEN